MCAALALTHKLVSRCTPCSNSQPQARSAGRHRLAVVAVRARRSVRCAAELDVSIGVKIGLAGSLGQLDLSEKGLESIPESVFELSGLEELSLAGNSLTEVPEAIAQLTSLRLLQLSGNQLRTLPEVLCKLPRLEGIWLGGNLLTRLPQNIGDFPALNTLSAPGNVLTEVPEALGRLTTLQQLVLSGNQLTALPSGISALGNLRKLELNGNALEALPDGVGALTALTQLTLQSNRLTSLPEGLGNLQALVELNVADNSIAELPCSLARLPRLKQLTVYGNRLSALAQELIRMPSLKGLWAEANPVHSHALLPVATELTEMIGSADDAPRRIGVDTAQVAGFPEELLAEAGKRLQVGEIIGSGQGYFKLARGAEPENGQIVDAGGTPGERLLVVTFSSAPGVPNWGSALRRVAKAAEDPAHACFDVLYVVDAARGWYSGGDEGFHAWHERLALATRRYGKVMMLGDSMGIGGAAQGATMALMCAQLATSVHVFCPQVDMSEASLRPGRELSWLAALRARLLANVSASSAAITAYVGSFLHDIDQAKLLPQEHVQLKVFTCDSHRLAFILDQRGKLVPLLRAAILSEMGFCAGNVRLQNLL